LLDVFFSHGTEFLLGLWVSLKLCLCIWTTSILGGCLLGYLSAKEPASIGMPVRAAGMCLMGVPPVVFLFWLHYPAQAVLGIVVDPFLTSIVALSIIGVFMVGDIVRNVIVDFPHQYLLAARVCGLSESYSFFKIVLPIAARQIIPNLLVTMVFLFQCTLFTSFISVNEVFRVAQRVNSMEYKPIEIFTALAIFCILFCLPLYLLANYVRSTHTRDIGEQ